MPKSFTLSIPTPCSEQWSAMAATETGRFCAHCDKNIIDCTKLSDDALMRIIDENNGKLCGKLTERQMNKRYAFAATPQKTPKYAGYIAAFFFLGKSITTQAQETAPIAIQLEQTSPLLSLQQPAISMRQPSLSIIKGTVMDSISNEPLIGCAIQIKGTETGVITDVNGYFALNIPEALQSETVLLIRYTGYHSKEIKVMYNKSPLQVLLVPDPDERSFLGGIVMYDYLPSRKWWQFWIKRRH